MKTIWKYEVSIEDRFVVPMPQNAEVLSVQEQNRRAFLWALVDPGNPVVSRTFRLYGTGERIESEAGKFIGTFQFKGLFVFHLFEETPAWN